MAKSFCNGCIHWQWYAWEYFRETGFHYCDKFETENLQSRKEKCNGKYWEEKK